MVYAGKDSSTKLLTESEIRRILRQALDRVDFRARRLLIIIPDGTRSGPVDLFFRLFHELLGDQVAALDYLIALGTHRPMSEQAIYDRLGVDPLDMGENGRYGGINVFNHAWEKPDTFCTLGEIPAEEIRRLTNGRFAEPIAVTINKMIFDYDLVLVCGPVFPHEVVGFSGGNKYFFPGISGQEVIDFTHWLGALLTSFAIIGEKDTPVRAVIDQAAGLIEAPKLACCFVVKDGGCAGVYVGQVEEAWSQAAELSRQVHIRYVDRPFRQVLSLMPEMYDDLWTAAKGMYKLEPIIADGGEVVIYAPHIAEVSYTHGHLIDEIGYHVRDYFVRQWERFSHMPWGVLAHSTHLRGIGSYEDGVERPRINVTLATQIPAERCRRLNLGYRDPASIDVKTWREREDEGILVVPNAGELLFRLKEAGP
jgi:nickel-dependent lactate racemase